MLNENREEGELGEKYFTKKLASEYQPKIDGEVCHVFLLGRAQETSAK